MQSEDILSESSPYETGVRMGNIGVISGHFSQLLLLEANLLLHVGVVPNKEPSAELLRPEINYQSS